MYSTPLFAIFNCFRRRGWSPDEEGQTCGEKIGLPRIVLPTISENDLVHVIAYFFIFSFSQLFALFKGRFFPF